METVADYKEIVDEIKAKGGEAFNRCYQCGLCDAVCPWNRLINFSMRKIVRQATFGLQTLSRLQHRPAGQAEGPGFVIGPAFIAQAVDEACFVE